MKRLLLILLVFMCFSENANPQERRRYALVWNDEFDADALNPSVWGKIWRSQADWAVHMTSRDALYGLGTIFDGWRVDQKQEGFWLRTHRD